MITKLGFALALVACSKATPSGSAAGSGGVAPAPASASASANPLSCDNIPKADFQALISDPITKVEGSTIGACNAMVGTKLGIAALIYKDNEVPFEPGPLSHMLSGVGDKAYWNDGDAGITGPSLHVLAGKTQCQIRSPAPPKSTLTGSADAYVQKLIVLCKDMLAAQ